MKATVISIFLLFLIPFASALDFTLNSPDSVNLNESFSVSITATTSDIYDVKIFVQDNSTKIIISEIYNNGWKNPFYYIKSIFPEKSEFELRAIDYSSNAALCARLRKTNSSSYSEKCNAISINQDLTVEEKTNNINKTTTEENRTTIQEINKSSTPEADFIPAGSPSQNQIEPIIEDKNQERIVLTPKKEEIFISNQEKIGLYAVYAFTFFALIIIILLSIRKL
jgi:hypothetical protein